MIKIGKYELIFKEDNYYSFLTDDKVWIRKDCGESGEFNKHELFKKLEAVIDEFYEENF